MNASGQLSSELLTIISAECLLDEKVTMKGKLDYIISNYQVSPLSLEVDETDLLDKIEIFLSAKSLEGLSKLTISGYSLELKIFAKNVKFRVSDINTEHIRSYLGKIKNLKMSSISKKLSVLKSFFNWLTSEEIIPRDPTKKIKPPKKEKRLPKALSIEELEMLRESCTTIRQRAFLEIMYATGCRLTEMHDINRRDINMQSMSCNVVGKGNKERTVYLSFKAMYHMRKYLLTRADDDEALMVTERKPHRRLTNRGIQSEIGRIAKKAGLEKKVSPHTLRHTFATLTLANGCDISTVQALLGHSDPATTMIYASVTEDRKREQHRKFLVQ